MVETTTQLHTPVTALAEMEDVHALTDVHRLRLAGHLLTLAGLQARREVRFDESTRAARTRSNG